MARRRIRAACYRRVSTPGQVKSGESLDDQRDRIASFVAARGWELVADFEDAGKSGRKDYRTRPAFLRMLREAANGAFDAVVVIDASRFSRNARDFLNVEAELSDIDVALVALNRPDFDPDDEDDVMGRGVEIMMGQWVANKSRRGSLRAKERRLDAGQFNMGQRIPYGLRWTDRAGTALEHDSETFPFWQLMMDLRNRGWGYGRIADALNGHASVEDRILRRYGVSLPVKNRYGMRIWREGAIASMFRDPSRWQGELELRFTTARYQKETRAPIVKTYTVPFPPLMTKADFDRFASLARKNLSWQPRNVGRGSLLSSLCKCGICGATLQVTGGRGYGYYGCANRLRPPRGEDRCRLPLIPKAELEDRVLQKMAEFLLDDEVFNKALALARPQEGGVTRAELDRQERLLRADLRNADARLGRLVKAVEEGLLEGEDIRRKRREIEAEKDKLGRRQAELDAKRALLARNAERVERVQEYRTWAARRMERAEDLLALSMEEQRDFLRGLLPLDSESCIRVDVLKPLTREQVARRPRNAVDPSRWASYDEYLESLPKWQLEITGLLAIEQVSLEKAVLGGALAVP